MPNLSTNLELLDVINEDVKSLKEWTNMPPISDEIVSQLLIAKDRLDDWHKNNPNNVRKITNVVEDGFMTKDLAILVGMNQNWMKTEDFIKKIGENLTELI